MLSSALLCVGEFLEQNGIVPLNDLEINIVDSFIPSPFLEGIVGVFELYTNIHGEPCKRFHNRKLFQDKEGEQSAVCEPFTDFLNYTFDEIERYDK